MFFFVTLGARNNEIANPERHELSVVIAVRSDPASKLSFVSRIFGQDAVATRNTNFIWVSFIWVFMGNSKGITMF